MNRDRILLITVILLALAFLTSVGILTYYVTHSQDLSASVQKSVQEELRKYNIETSKKLSIDDSKVILSIAKYCEVNDGCRGPQGIAGISLQGAQGMPGAQGAQGIQGTQGSSGESIVGPAGKDGIDGKDGKDGVDGVNGNDGTDGAPGPRTERRCNAEKNRMEWRNEGDETWQAEYNLGLLQTCPSGE